MWPTSNVVTFYHYVLQQKSYRAGRHFEHVVEAIGLETADLFPDPQSAAQKRPPQKPRTRVARPKVTTKASDVVKAKPEKPQTKKAVKKKRRSLKTATGAVADWAQLTVRYQRAADQACLHTLAKETGLPLAALKAIRAGWNRRLEAFTFPEFDGQGHVVGIATRRKGGQKKAISGSKRGLCLPIGWEERPGPILIVEGATDTAALVAMGLAGIGRPSAKGGVALLAELLADIPADRDILVLGEMDAKPDGSWPGREGAEHVAGKLSTALARPIDFALPPGGAKDMRAWLMQQEVADGE